MANDINYTPVTDGFYNCRIVYARRAEAYFGHDVKAHVVFDIKLVPTNTEIENPAAYKATFPILLTIGFEWEFYDEQTKKFVWRKVTAADTKKALENAQKCFPEWKEYCDGLQDGSEAAAFGWFCNADLNRDAVVRAKLSIGKEFTGKDGMAHNSLNARIYPPYEAKPIVAEAESAQLSRSLKAAGVKLFGKPKTASAPVPPKKPEEKSVDILREQAFELYQQNFKEDANGSQFYTKCAEIFGKDVNTWESWTVSDWEKICHDIEIPF